MRKMKKKKKILFVHNLEADKRFGNVLESNEKKSMMEKESNKIQNEIFKQNKNCGQFLI